MTEIWSFSGTHPFHPTVLAATDAYEGATADEIVKAIDSGNCPRCWGLLPTLPEYPAGSRITQYGSIPVCGRCGSDEVFNLAAASEWPVCYLEMEVRRERFMAKATIATIDPKEIVNPRNTGGWAQHGTAIEEL